MTTYLLTLLPKLQHKIREVEVTRLEVETVNSLDTMAPVDLQRTYSYVPAGILGSHISSVGVASLIVARSLYRSYVALPPSSATRHREPTRKGHVSTFAALALLSLVTSLFYFSQFAGLSYRVWAAERGVELPNSIFGDRGAFRGGEHPGRLQIFRWLSDTPLYRDSLEIIAEKARYFWWGQQVNMGLVSWSTYLAIEGQRRKISNLWAFLALSQLVNLSYAQNLFFVAVLLTPVPLPGNVKEITRSSIPATSTWLSNLGRKVFPPKPDGFLPKSGLYITLLLANFSTIFLIPFAANTPSFMAISILSRAIPFSTLALPYLIPSSWGTIHKSLHSAHNEYTTLFRIISVSSALLHLKSTAIALFYNTPDAYYRHSLLHPFKEHRSTFNRGTTAVSRVFGAVLEHPAVSYEGWDVIFSGLCLGVWAAVRGLDAREMLGSALIFLKRTAKEAEETLVELSDSAIKKIERSSSIRQRRSRKAEDEDTITTIDKPKRRSQASRKAIENGDDPNDTTYKPTEPIEEGDEEGDEDWEAGALAWGLITTGGLGSGSASVYGAETMAR